MAPHGSPSLWGAVGNLLPTEGAFFFLSRHNAARMRRISRPLVERPYRAPNGAYRAAAGSISTFSALHLCKREGSRRYCRPLLLRAREAARSCSSIVCAIRLPSAPSPFASGGEGEGSGSFRPAFSGFWGAERAPTALNISKRANFSVIHSSFYQIFIKINLFFIALTALLGYNY